MPSCFKGVPRDLRNKGVLRKWFRRRYPWCDVSEVYLTFFTAKIHRLERRQELYEKSIGECRPWSRLFRCRGSCLCGCECLLRSGDSALEYYVERLLEADERIESQKVIALMKPLDTAFVVLKRESMARSIVQYERNEKLGASQFSVSFAPPVDGKKKNEVLHTFAVDWKTSHSSLLSRFLKTLNGRT